MRAIDSKRLENDMIDSIWSFLQMGGMRSNYPSLKKACMEMRQMMMQKTAGQRKERPQDLPWDNLERVKATIIVEAMALVLSGDFESHPAAKVKDCEETDETVRSAKKNVSEIMEFCGSWDCTVCPFVKEDEKKCSIYTPISWKIKGEKK